MWAYKVDKTPAVENRRGKKQPGRCGSHSERNPNSRPWRSWGPVTSQEISYGWRNAEYQSSFGEYSNPFSTSLPVNIVEFFLQISVALFFLLQNFIDLLLQLFAIIANHARRL